MAIIALIRTVGLHSLGSMAIEQTLLAATVGCSVRSCSTKERHRRASLSQGRWIVCSDELAQGVGNGKRRDGGEAWR